MDVKNGFKDLAEHEYIYSAASMNHERRPSNDQHRFQSLGPWPGSIPAAGLGTGDLVTASSDEGT